MIDMRLFEIQQTVDYPLAGKIVDGLAVGDDIKNTGSISASLNDYEVLKGIRVVPMFPDITPHDLFYARDDLQRARNLAVEIQENGRIDPLIVVIDSEGPYVLEGGHRLAALLFLKKKEFPALVVIDRDEVSEE